MRSLILSEAPRRRPRRHTSEPRLPSADFHGPVERSIVFGDSAVIPSSRRSVRFIFRLTASLNRRLSLLAFTLFPCSSPVVNRGVHITTKGATDISVVPD